MVQPKIYLKNSSFEIQLTDCICFKYKQNLLKMTKMLIDSFLMYADCCNNVELVFILQHTLESSGY